MAQSWLETTCLDPRATKKSFSDYKTCFGSKKYKQTETKQNKQDIIFM